MSAFSPADGPVRKEEELSNVLHTGNSWHSPTYGLQPTLHCLHHLQAGHKSSARRKLEERQKLIYTIHPQAIDIETGRWNNQSSWNLYHICFFSTYQGDRLDNQLLSVVTVEGAVGIISSSMIADICTSEGRGGEERGGEGKDKREFKYVQ